jgi:hypothetical protein
MYKVALAALVAVALMAPALGAPDGSVAWPSGCEPNLEAGFGPWYEGNSARIICGEHCWRDPCSGLFLCSFCHCMGDCFICTVERCSERCFVDKGETECELTCRALCAAALATTCAAAAAGATATFGFGGAVVTVACGVGAEFLGPCRMFCERVCPDDCWGCCEAISYVIIGCSTSPQPRRLITVNN